MKLERSKNAKRNIIFGMVNKVLLIILPFIARTIIIKILGSEYLGLNSLFSSILQVLNLSELGFSSAVVYSMYKPIAENDYRTICALLQFYRTVYRIIGSVVLIIGLILMPFLPHLISGTVPDEINIYYLYLLYLINTSLSYFLFAYKSSLLNAFQRNDIISNVQTLTQGVMYILQIAILFLTRNYYLFILMMPIFTLLYNLMNAQITKNLYPQYVCKGKVNHNILKDIRHQVAGLMVNKLCQTSRNSFDSIFISAFLGLTVTAMYGNYYYVLNAIIALLSVFNVGMLAGAGNSIVLDSREKNYADMKKINFIYMWLSGWCTICLACLYQPFMKLWVGENLMFSYPIVIMFCIYFYSLQMGVIRGLYSDAAGLWWENRFRAIIESIANLVLNFILVQLWGILGIIAATLISLLIVNFGFGSQIVFKYYFKNGKLLEYFLLHAKYAIVTLLICSISYFTTSLIPEEGIMGFILKGLGCCILPNVLYFVFYCKTKEFAVSIPWLLSVFHISYKIKKLPKCN